MLARALLALALLVTLGPAGSARADDPVRVVGARDQAGDVRMLDNPRGLTKTQRRSIDIRTLEVDDLGRRTRFTVRLERITASKRFDQQVRIQVNPRNWAGSGDPAPAIVASAQHPRQAGVTAAFSDGRYIVCGARARVQRRTVVIVVGSRCLPRTRSRIVMQAATGDPRFIPDWSRDSLRVPGLHVVR